MVASSNPCYISIESLRIAIIPNVVGLIWGNDVPIQVLYPGVIDQRPEPLSIIGVIGILDIGIGPYKIIVALELQPMLLKCKIIQLKAVTSRICCPTL